ncbi:putative endonuclease exonuclease phosphatase family protein [Rosellinia necatrix]|uniref:Putative endonuclease exonuclease phosphatase family protein n=1 Tax=Rosellinia necatrix TaxID=77044 RepID=A0A1W2TM30_ROSNE|nr:putative endonuclease exonuclease phosphatase family protein [Rosellinia necatrix]
MEAIVAQAIRDGTAQRKTSVPWNADEPHPQPYYAFDSARSSWVSKSPSPDGAHDEESAEITNIAVYSWNIDFILPFAEARMKPALAHLHELVSSKDLPPSTAPVIFLQECTPSDFATITAQPWVRERFHITDLDHAHWATTQYGTTTLADARLPVAAVFRVHYSRTRMDRDGLFVDVRAGGRRVRLCNTHLESMAFDPPFRPAQMELVARHMHEARVDVAVAAGDFNAIQPFDRSLHGANDLRDAFLEAGGREDTDDAYTWGQQAATALRDRFGCSRMDKVYYCCGAADAARLVRFARFGRDVMAEGEEVRREIVALGFERPWVTDHLGVMAEIAVVPPQSGNGLP